MMLPPLKVCRRIRQLFRLIGSSNANEAASAREKLVTLLTKHGLNWIDIPACVAEADAADGDNAPKPAAPSDAAGPGPEVNVLDLVLRLVELHIGLTPEQRMGVALWILHTHVFGRFPITPRLALLSPVRGCGKTTLLVLLELLCSDPDRTDNITAASIYHLLATREHSLLIDEGDNLGLWTNNVLRAVFNAGHRRGGAIRRFVGGRSRKFPVFAPLGVAAIGTLPLPLMHRAIIINMQRHAPGSARLLQLDEADPTFPAARAEIQKWAATCSLAREPEMPPQLRNRTADNWSVLLAIADDLGQGEEARAAAVALSGHRLDEDPGITLLTDIRAVFGASGADRIASATLVEALLALDDGLWHDWRGPKDDRPPRKLTQSELARLLRPFEIRPRTIWPANRALGSKSFRGYGEKCSMPHGRPIAQHLTRRRRAAAAYGRGDERPRSGRRGLHPRRRSEEQVRCLRWLKPSREYARSWHSWQSWDYESCPTCGGENVEATDARLQGHPQQGDEAAYVRGPRR